MAILNVEGTRLDYRWVEGSSPAPPLVYLHDGLGSVSTWRDFPDRVSTATGCSGLIYSRRGHGASEALTGDLPDSFMHDEAGILARLLGILGLSDPVLIGHSDGASIALIAQARGELRARGLVLVAPHVFVEERTVLRIAHDVERYRSEDLRPRLEKHHGTNAASMFQSWTDVWLRPSFRSWSIEGLLSRVSCPVLCIQGIDDEYGTLEQVARLRRLLSGPSTARVLDQCGHSPFKDRTEDTLDEIARFARDLGIEMGV